MKDREAVEIIESIFVIYFQVFTKTDSTFSSQFVIDFIESLISGGI